MRRLLLLSIIPGLLAADDHWVKFTRGPLEVMTDAGARSGRETMVRFEQFRAALGQIVGEDDLQAPLPLRIFVFKNANGWTSAAPLTEGRDHFCIVLSEKSAVTPEIYSALTRLFLKSNTAQMPPAFERGLVAFFSTFEVSGIRITAGKPPAQPDLDWARIHLMVVDPDYYGRIRVLLYNLRHGVADDPSYRNAFGKSAAAVEAAAKQHFAAGNFQTTRLPSRPMAEGDFPERQVSSTDIALARGDLLVGAPSAAEYRKLLAGHEKVAEAEEGLGLLALREHRADEAHRDFAAAMEAGSTSARCYIEFAKLEPDSAKAEQALLNAGINPKLDEPFALLAKRDTDPRKRLMHWKAAAERDPRNPSYWRALAETYLADHNYGEAAKAWRSGEQAATDPAERERMHQARMSIEQQRLDYEEAEKRREAEEKAREIDRLKTEARAELHKAEARFSDGAPSAGGQVVPWWEGPKPGGTLKGILKRVDCLPRQQARLYIEDDAHRIVKLLVADPAKVVYAGSGEVSLGCGVQKSRRVAIAYFPKANARLATAGEVATIDFQ
jgi:hypothetical protein